MKEQLKQLVMKKGENLSIEYEIKKGIALSPPTLSKPKSIPLVPFERSEESLQIREESLRRRQEWRRLEREQQESANKSLMNVCNSMSNIVDEWMENYN